MTTLSQIAYSGINASQVSMASTGQNIANVNTPGFSRLQTVTASLSGAAALNAGGGVKVIQIRRLSNDFQNQQLWRAVTEQGFHQTAQQYLTALEGLMVGEGSSISVGLDRFFAALSEASVAPGSVALRQQVISEARNLAQRFNGLNGNIQAQIGALQEQRRATVGEINALARNLAMLNKEITASESIAADTTALRDQRENLIKQLSEYAALRVNETPDGALTVAFRNGQPLVVGPTAATLELTDTPDGDQTFSLSFAGTRFPLRQDDFGGSLGGLYRTEQVSLRPMQSALHEMARQMSEQVNSLLGSGFDLNGNPGQALFTYNPTSITGMLEINPLTAQELAFSSAAGESGNNEALLTLLSLKNFSITVNGSVSTLSDAYAGLLGRVASDSRQNQADLSASTTVAEQAQAQRDSVSAVNLDEEAVNLMTYQQAYQANMKVITTANRLFDDLLAAF